MWNAFKISGGKMLSRYQEVLWAIIVIIGIISNIFDDEIFEGILTAIQAMIGQSLENALKDHWKCS